MFTSGQRGRELNTNRTQGILTAMFSSYKGERTGADMKLKLDKHGLVGTEWCIMLLFIIDYIKI